MGSPRRVISAYAQKWAADLIVAGSHGHGPIGRFFLGSVAQGILRTASCSVEIVRDPAGSRAPSSHPMKILVATDGSEYSLAAARSVAAWPWPVGTVFKILSVEELLSMPIPVEVSSLAAIYPESLLKELMTTARVRMPCMGDSVGWPAVRSKAGPERAPWKISQTSNVPSKRSLPQGRPTRISSRLHCTGLWTADYFDRTSRV
jgi:Universal stress protein family